ncbi:hypothetical protein [Nocardia sp. NBC_00416]|uniref:hypothetical protein n=1 Tax=Nocardia sp. NBC_00416 TaxID=2975991 RepID=UPI002E1F6B9B
MVPFSVFSEQLPAISAKLGIEESTLSSVLTSVGPFAASQPTGPHMPGAILAAGFKAMKEAYFTNLDAGVLEKLRGGEALVPVSVSFEATDTAGSVSVSASDQAIIAAAGKAVADDILGN